MNRIGLLLMMVLLVPVSLHAEIDDDDNNADNGPPAVKAVSLSQVPPAALAAARKEKPDVFFDSAERIIWKDDPVYQINGAKGREIWSVFVSVQGNVLRVESDAREDSSRD